LAYYFQGYETVLVSGEKRRPFCKFTIIIFPVVTICVQPGINGIFGMTAITYRLKWPLQHGIMGLVGNEGGGLIVA
jgi:hypothetical protein